MTREEWAERLPLIQAFVEGETIETRNMDTWYRWVEVKTPTFRSHCEYRIKPEPKVIYVNEYRDNSCAAFLTETAAQNFVVNVKPVRVAVKYQEVIE